MNPGMLVLVGVVCVVATTRAAPTYYGAALNGASVVAPTMSSATGTASVTLENGLLVVSGSFAGLEFTVASAHVRGPAAPGANGPIVLNLATTGTNSGQFLGSGALTPQQQSALAGGLLYVSVVSIGYPGGEIRGQIVPLPPPVVTVQLIGPKRRAVASRKEVLAGVASATRGAVSHVEAKVRDRPYRRARGIDPWQFKVRLKMGLNRVRVRAIGEGGEQSQVVTVRIRRK